MRESHVTFLLILISFLVFGVSIVLVSLGIVSESYIIQTFGFSYNNLFQRPWCIITSIFIHQNLDHLVSNMIALLFFGIAVETKMGWKKTLLIFFLGAFAGELLSLVFYVPDIISIGASAGVFALVGTGMIVRPLGLTLYPPFYILPLGLVGILYALYNVIGFVMGIGNVSYIAHFGGLITGFYFGAKEEGFEKAVIIIGVFS
ncbi:MAG: rhomboid family intramembrane serine protease, partial [Candidatus Aenigmarchaeota archaeon]|nr:rhomboid family intramembrane serine protease [Candidatus Aenigmarchaeota archaeon]